MSRGFGRIERVCLNVLEEAEADQPVVGRTAHEIAVVAFAVRDRWGKGETHGVSNEDHRQMVTALSSVHRALQRLQAKGLVYESGLSAGHDPNEGTQWEGGHMYCEGRKLYRMTVLS